MKDFTILNIDTHLSASKNLEYRNSTFAYYGALVKFLQMNGLVQRTLINEGDPLPSDFKLMRSDLTDEGFEVLKTSLDRWLVALSSGRKGLSDVSPLEKALKKIRDL